MSLFENESIKRIVTRFKKLFLILLLLPIIFGGLGYFIGMNQETSSTAKAEIKLGDFKNTEFNDVGTVQENLKSEKFLEKLKREYDLSYDSLELSGKTNPTVKPGKIIELSYTTESNKESEKILQELVDAFLNESNNETNNENNISFKEKKDSIEARIEKVKLFSGNEVVKEDLLYNLESDLEELKPAKLHKDVSVDETNNNPLRKAILGFLVGLMFSISLLLFPEVIRK
ncbi:hypothetical protein [Fictibacillus sp. 26RED30]|uniref:hypothetical protein n=1 Tax=Fictibacillus sp. 26RED30 TaxID=2745877 RepID=UPI0018CE95EA|nr:hypothetical protein [Fictibacillus sp. 26RED30]MBH0161712.1 hypothetical protein [Fictibacillus sp. 26RED30]